MANIFLHIEWQLSGIMLSPLISVRFFGVIIQEDNIMETGPHANAKRSGQVLLDINTAG